MSTNISIKFLNDNNYKIFYNNTYDHATKYSDLNEIKSYCNDNSIICVGASQSNSNTLLLVSCGNCKSILTETNDKIILNNGAYWYFKNKYSFGFSPNDKIDLNYADINDCILNKNQIYECTQNNRLSWHLTNYNGGWRVGNKTGLNNSKDYLKYIFLKDYDKSKAESAKTTTKKPTRTTSSTSTTTTTTLNKSNLLFYLY